MRGSQGETNYGREKSTVQRETALRPDALLMLYQRATVILYRPYVLKLYITTLTKRNGCKNVSRNGQFDALRGGAAKTPNHVPPQKIRKMAEILQFQPFSWHEQKDSNSRHAVLEVL